MTRSIEFQQPNDTCLFTPLQLQPVAAFRCGMSTWARWLAANVASFPALVRDHELGAVVIGGYVTWLRPCTFFDCDGVRVTGDVRVIHKRALFREDFHFFATGGKLDGQHIADGIGIMRPLHVPRDAGLAATPIPVPPQLIARLQPDEIADTELAPRPVTELAKQLEGQTPLAEGEVRTFCSRAQSEVADQWSFVEVPGFGSHAREALVLGAGKRELRRGLREPLRACQVEYRKPACAFDELVVRTRAFELAQDLVFLHEVRVAGDPDVRAMIVERF